MSALALAGATAAFVVVRETSDQGARIEARLSVVALALLLAALARGWARLVPLPILLLGGTYGAQLVAHDSTLDAGAAAVGAGLLLASELAYWSLEEREGIPVERGAYARRAGVVAAMGSGALLTVLALLAVASLVRGTGLAIDLAGALALGALALGAWALAQERRKRSGDDGAAEERAERTRARSA